MASNSTSYSVPPGRVASRVQIFQSIQDLEKNSTKLNETPRVLTPATESSTIISRGRHQDTYFGLPTSRAPQDEVASPRTRYGMPTKMTASQPRPSPADEMSDHHDFFSKLPVPSVPARPATASGYLEGRTSPQQLSACDGAEKWTDQLGHKKDNFGYAAVRSKLRPVQDRLQSNPARDGQKDDMMNKLGSMLDDAIATSMAPPIASIRDQGPPSGKSSSAGQRKQEQNPPTPPRQRMRWIRPSLDTIIDGSRTASPEYVQSPKGLRSFVLPEKPSQLPVFSPRLRSRTLTETSSPAKGRELNPSSDESRPQLRYIESSLGLDSPLPELKASSPVRQRALLWESMARDASVDQAIFAPPNASSSLLRHDTGEPVRKPMTRPFTGVDTTHSSPRSSSPQSSSKDIGTNLIQQEVTSVTYAAPSRGVTEAVAHISDEQPAHTAKTRYTRSSGQPSPQQHSKFRPGSLKSLHSRDSSVTICTSDETTVGDIKCDDHQPRSRASLVQTRMQDLLKADERHHPENYAYERDTATTRLEPIKTRIPPERRKTGDSAATRVSPMQGAGGKQGAASLDENRSEEDPNSSTSEEECVSANLTFPKNSPVRSVPGTPHRSAPGSAGRTTNGSPKKFAHGSPARGRTMRVVQHDSPGGRRFAVEQRFALSPTRSISRLRGESIIFEVEVKKSPGKHRGEADEEELIIRQFPQPPRESVFDRDL